MNLLCQARCLSGTCHISVQCFPMRLPRAEWNLALAKCTIQLSAHQRPECSGIALSPNMISSQLHVELIIAGITIVSTTRLHAIVMTTIIDTVAKYGFRGALKILFSTHNPITKSSTESQPQYVYVRKRRKSGRRESIHVYHVTQDGTDGLGRRRSTYTIVEDSHVPIRDQDNFVGIQKLVNHDKGYSSRQKSDEPWSIGWRKKNGGHKISRSSTTPTNANATGLIQGRQCPIKDERSRHRAKRGTRSVKSGRGRVTGYLTPETQREEGAQPIGHSTLNSHPSFGPIMALGKRRSAQPNSQKADSLSPHSFPSPRTGSREQPPGIPKCSTHKMITKQYKKQQRPTHSSSGSSAERHLLESGTSSQEAVVSGRPSKKPAKYALYEANVFASGALPPPYGPSPQLSQVISNTNTPRIAQQDTIRIVTKSQADAADHCAFFTSQATQSPFHQPRLSMQQSDALVFGTGSRVGRHGGSCKGSDMSNPRPEANPSKQEWRDAQATSMTHATSADAASMPDLQTLDNSRHCSKV